MKERLFHFLSVAAGILIGVLLVLTIQHFYGKNTLRVPRGDGDWRKLNLILECLDANYVDSIDHKAVTDAALTAALSRLDPHSVYLQPTQLIDSEEELEGNFDGIGIQFNVPSDTAVVMEVIPGGPSEKTGLRKGDRILKVDSVVIAGVNYPQDSMVRRMKGPAGTKVTLLIKRECDEIPFEITRGKIPVNSIDAAFMVSDTVGYIRFSKFSRTTFSEFYKESGELLKQGMKYLIVDIRENSGGYLDQALLLSDLFLEKDDMIVYLEGLHRKREEYKADGKGNLKDLKLSVLIDDGSASSSEIFAGAIQDNGRGTIVGRRSFGKGLVQEPIYLSDGSGVRLTVARFYTPSGRCLQKPYTDDYNYDYYKRFQTGEMLVADSMKLENGGIIPDVFVPADTTKATAFYSNCARKTTVMRFASAYFDAHKKELSSISDFDRLIKYLDAADLETKFLEFARQKDGLVPAPGEWSQNRQYVMTQVRSQIGRYSALGDKAFYHIYLQVDPVFHCAMNL